MIFCFFIFIFWFFNFIFLITLFYLLHTNCNSTFATLRQDRACKRVIWRDGEYTNNILGRNKFIMTA